MEEEALVKMLNELWNTADGEHNKSLVKQSQQNLEKPKKNSIVRIEGMWPGKNPSLSIIEGPNNTLKPIITSTALYKPEITKAMNVQSLLKLSLYATLTQIKKNVLFYSFF